jgi:N-acetylmuramic acid 6-phosphate etherase
MRDVNDSDSSSKNQLSKDLPDGFVLVIDVDSFRMRSWVSSSQDLLGVESEPLMKGGVEEEATPLPTAGIEEWREVIAELVEKRGLEGKLDAIGITLSGVVSYAGDKLERAFEPCPVAGSSEWIADLRESFSCSVSLVNVADAAMIGAARVGLSSPLGAVGMLTVGNGLDFSVQRNGQRWCPGWRQPQLGGVRTVDGSYRELLSRERLVGEDLDHGFKEILSQEDYEEKRVNYLRRLAQVILSGTSLYGLQEIFIGGDLADAVGETGFALQKQVVEQMELDGWDLEVLPKVKVLQEGSRLSLYGAALLAVGNLMAERLKYPKAYDRLETERAYDPKAQLQNLSAKELVELMNEAEVEVGEQLKKSSAVIAELALVIADAIREGGRLVYLGAGSSGRIAALDAVEIPVTYGVTEGKVVALVSGGLADAAVEIESAYEEDASSVPDLLGLNITRKDVVVGISASGNAYYVQSGLGYAKSIGAQTALIQVEEEADSYPFCDKVIAMHTGKEVVGGSTRMKAGTATKKILNMLTTTAMVLLGKVEGSYMVDLVCTNQKGEDRAGMILNELYAVSKEEALELLKKHENRLQDVVDEVRARQS